MHQTANFGNNLTSMAVGSMATNPIDHLPLVSQEVNRRLALGVPRGIDRSDLVGEAEEALVVHCARGTNALRLAVRGALQNYVNHEAMRQSHDGPMPADVAAPKPTADEVAELVFHLTPRQMTAVRLIFYGGLTQEEAAEEMNCCQQDVSSLINVSVKRLREALMHSREVRGV